MFITAIAHGYHQNQGDWEEKFQYQSPVSWKPFDELIKLELLTVTCLHKRDTLGRHDHSISTQQQLTTPCQHHYKYWKLRGDDQIRTRSDADWPMPLSGLAIMLTHCWHQSQRKKTQTRTNLRESHGTKLKNVRKTKSLYWSQKKCKKIPWLYKTHQRGLELL